MLGMALGMADVEDALNKIDIGHIEHSRLIGPYPATIQESKEYRHDNSASEHHKSAGCGRQAVAGLEEVFQLEFRESMGYVGAGFHLWDVRPHDICHLAVSQVADEVRDDVYPRPATIVCLCGALRAPTVHHFLGQRPRFRERPCAMAVEKEHVVIVCLVPSPGRFLKDDERFHQGGKKGLKPTHRRTPPRTLENGLC